MPILRIPTPLRSYTAGSAEVPVQGETVAQVMEDLLAKHPSLRPHLFNGEGRLRPYVNLFIAGNNIKDLQGLDTPLKPDDKVMLIPSIAGG